LRLLNLFIVVCLCSSPTPGQLGNRLTGDSQAQNLSPENIKGRAKAAPSSLQLAFRVPFAPTVFPSESHLYVVYEIHLVNFSPTPTTLKRLEVIDADLARRPPVAVFQGEQLTPIVRLLGGKTPSDLPNEGILINGGQSAIAFMWVAFDGSTAIPTRLLHRVITSNGESEGALITTHETKLHVLGPPLEGTDWLAADGPSNDEDNHHRRGVYVYDGQVFDSRRYAIDWKQMRDGASFSGEARDVHSYYAYGKNVLAVADARVVTTRDGIPENVPGHGQDFHPAVPITYETAHGNTVVLDLGGGQFAHYHHLQPGSLRVKTGDRVHRGQILALVGDSGDAREPHLHFEVTTSPMEGMGEGIPYLIDQFRCKRKVDGSMELRTHELPLGDRIVTFREDGAK
jgi:peptidase M23-like protein